MNQTALFPDREFPPASRTADPSSSKAAEQRMNATGARKTQAQTVLEAVTQWPGRTAQEMATTLPLDNVQITRRLGDLTATGKVKKGKARQCAVQGTNATTWYPA